MRLWLFNQYKICTPTTVSIKICHFSSWSSYNLTAVIFWDVYHSKQIFLHLPLFQLGWHNFRSLQVRAGFFWDPSGLRKFSIWLLRDFREESTSTSCCLRELEASSALMYLRGSGDFSVWPRPAKADMSIPGPGGPGGPGGPVLPGGPWERKYIGTWWSDTHVHAQLRWQKSKKFYTQQDHFLQIVHEVQGGQWGRAVH